MLKKPKVKIIPKHLKKECYFCDGDGCKRCNYTGIYVQTYYHMIYTDKNGQKMAFGVDTVK